MNKQAWAALGTITAGACVAMVSEGRLTSGGLGEVMGAVLFVVCYRYIFQGRFHGDE